MTDFFALLGQPRRPWLDPESIKTTFHALSTQLHPDRTHGAPPGEREISQARCAELNAAHQKLREPRDRLLHLLELERGAPPADLQQLPSSVMDLFLQLGRLCRQIDEFLAERAQVTAPMLKVRFFQRALDWTDQVAARQKELRDLQDTIHRELKELNGAWETAPAPGDPTRPGHLPLDRLEQLYRLLSYVSRWTGQLQERFVQLSLL